jgi:general secretion pathway protein K
MDALYSALGPTFQPRHASLEEIEELLFVRGMTPELFYGNYVEDAEGRLYARGGLRDCLSVWGSPSFVDANGADPAVLAAIGLNPGQVQTIVDRRAAKPFENIGELQTLGLPPNRLSVNQTSMWTIRATARLRRPDGSPSDVVRSSAAVVKYWTDNKPHASALQVLRYYQDAWSESMVRPQ